MTSTLVGNAAQSPAPSSMKAWRVHEFGPPEAMIFETVPRPDPGPGEVLVKVHAAGVGPWDGSIRAGRSALPQPLPLRLIPRSRRGSWSEAAPCLRCRLPAIRRTRIIVELDIRRRSLRSQRVAGNSCSGMGDRAN
jgi:hypothetical protein